MKIALVVALLTAVSAVPKPSPKGGIITYPPLAPGVINALGKGQDPAPLRDGKTYLFPDVDFGKNVYLRTSEDLNTVQSVDSNEHLIYTFADNILTEAPDISTYEDKYALYISAVQINHIYVIASDTKNPLGKYSGYGIVTQPDGTPIEGYDAHIINHPNGKRYMTWSTSYHAAPSISIVELVGLNKTTGPPVAILTPTEPYEMLELPSGDFGPKPVLEAPSSWVFGDTLNIGYACNQYSDATYNTNIAYASVRSDPMDPKSWNKAASNPVLSSSNVTHAYGPGSGGFFVGPDNTPWFSYGAFSNPNGFTNSSNIRTVRAQKVFTDKEGVVQRMLPIKATRSIPNNGGYV